ncbi:Protein of unknown function [Bacillus mycoides]|jgi:hypothetical protein|nr:Protein of unknown function [Bacillus mycoides]
MEGFATTRPGFVGLEKTDPPTTSISSFPRNGRSPTT